MRPKLLDLDPANEDLVGFASNVTGGTWTVTTNNTPDSLAHQISLRNDSVTDHSAKTATFVGLDADGRSQTETINMPGPSATVETTKYFKRLNTVTPSATIGADTMDIGWVDEIASQTIPLDQYRQVAATVQVTVTGTINYDIEVTADNVYGTSADPAPFTINDQNDFDWLNDALWAGKTASTADNLSVPGHRALRVVTNSYSSGAELQVYITQPD